MWQTKTTTAMMMMMMMKVTTTVQAMMMMMVMMVFTVSDSGRLQGWFCTCRDSIQGGDKH